MSNQISHTTLHMVHRFFNSLPPKMFRRSNSFRELALFSIDFVSFQEIPRVPEFLALSAAYFLSVLMVSKYRDILEPSDTFFAPPTDANSRPTSCRSARISNSSFCSKPPFVEPNGIGHKKSVASNSHTESLTSGPEDEHESIVLNLDSNRVSSDEASGGTSKL